MQKMQKKNIYIYMFKYTESKIENSDNSENSEL